MNAMRSVKEEAWLLAHRPDSLARNSRRQPAACSVPESHS